MFFSGGVAHNSKAMHKIACLSEIKKFTVPPSPGDSGAALGAANFGHIVLKNKFISFPPLFFSNNFFAPNTDIFSDLFKEMKKKILFHLLRFNFKGEIICIYDGGSETGPRH